MNRILKIQFSFFRGNTVDSFVIPEIDHTDLPFFLNFQKRLYHLRVRLGIILWIRIEHHRAMPRFFCICNDILNRAADSFDIEALQIAGFRNFTERAVACCIVSGQLADKKIHLLLWIKPVAHTLDIGILTIINQRGSVDRFFDAGTAVFLRYVLRKRIVVGSKALRHGGSQKYNCFSF